MRLPLFSQSGSNGRYPTPGLERYLYIWVPKPFHDFSGNEPCGWLGGRVYRKIDGLDLARSEAKGVLVGQSLL